MTTEQAERSNDLYCFAMRLTDAGASEQVVDPLIKELCELGGVDFPPEQMEVVCST